ncbi:uncharacterized protein LOC126850606 [Cataglyphis hispanica]|uniref:uncharacterized protein LOC126850606 n=1 Tax=Cataglyphis hispanica TaxID=1086592 RepID=UPI00218021CD|nr:uncharacterized protein LOC126850606 [Cataglyphis hispanica]
MSIITNIGSEEILDITDDEIKLALCQMKGGRASNGKDGITQEMLQLDESVTLYSLNILLNKCLQTSKVYDNWQNAHLSYKKGDKLNIENYRLISLLPHSYKLLTKIIINRLTNKFDSYQPPEQARFRKDYSTIEQIQNIKTLIEKCTEYNVQIHLAFIDYSKAFDSWSYRPYLRQ